MAAVISVSIVIPIHNGAKWIDRCFQSIIDQTAVGKISLEVCVCDDASTDATLHLLKSWQSVLSRVEISLKIIQNSSSKGPKGVGYSKNRAVAISEGTYLCFQDVDDIMLPNRIDYQYKRALTESDNTIIGSKFVREPPESTRRYCEWTNGLTQAQLPLQVYTSHGPTVIMPTWFCHRRVFETAGGFCEKAPQGIPEDLIFFYTHLDGGGKVCRVDKPLVVYTYHSDATTFSVSAEAIWKVRLERLERIMLKNWTRFTIWNGNRLGRRFYRALSADSREKVVAMCDISSKLVGTTYVPYFEDSRSTGRAVPIIHFKDATRPFVICVKQGLTGGDFERNLGSLRLIEGKDYIFF